jgi:hypothetical protein
LQVVRAPLLSPGICLALSTLLISERIIQAADPALEAWRSPQVHPATPRVDRHVIHAYFNTCPESPDGKYVLYYTSTTAEGEKGDLRIVERATGRETILADNIETEDAHRAACQQWSNGGRTVVYHNHHDGRWQVVAIDLASRKSKVLADDHQLGFGSSQGSWAPIYGCHWNPGSHRDLKLVHVLTGETRAAVTAAEVIAAEREWITRKFGSTEISLFFPVLSPDETKVFFKLSLPSGGSDFRSKQASVREGKLIYDLKARRLVRLVEEWGHPSWTPDSTGIFERGNYVMNVESGRNLPRYAPSAISDHPTLAPDARLFVTDGDASKRDFGKPGHWAIVLGSTNADEFAVVDVFDNTQGARSWRRNHPHPAFSADGRRIYYNVNDGKWTRLMVAEQRP